MIKSIEIHSSSSSSSSSIECPLAIPSSPTIRSLTIHPINEEKNVTFQVTTNSFNRQIQVKTSQEEEICRGKQSISSSRRKEISRPIVSCSSTREYSFPHRIEIEQEKQMNSSSIENIRLSVNSSSSMGDEKKENLFQEETNEKMSLDRRPLFDLLNEDHQRRQTKNNSNLIPNIQSTNSSPSISSARKEILPAKSFNPFRPIIIHRKSQDYLGQFQPIPKENQEEKEDSFPFDQRNHRNALLRSQTFSSPSTDLQSNSSHPILSSSFPADHPNSPLSLSHTSLTSSSPNPNLLPTIDDKYEAKRKAIAMQMYDTENSYVEALKNLVTKYYLPMKEKLIVSNDLINDIFYKIPEIHIHHTAFLISLSQKLSQWNNKQTVGDLLLQMFTRTSVIETYTSFVNNYQTAQLAIRLCRDFSSFNKFLEQQARDHRGKLTLRDLIIQPVQRIPRYELYIKDFLKCTNINHPDYQLLLKAQSEIHSLAAQIDRVQREVSSTTDLNLNKNSLEIVQEMIDDLNDLVQADRYYIRHDNITIEYSSGIKKDRFIFLFNDLILITSSKRRTGSLAKKSNNSIIVNSPSGKQYLDNAKHKLIQKIPLENVDLADDPLKKTRQSLTTPPLLIKSKTNCNLDQQRELEDDLLILHQMNDLAKTIISPHQQLDQSIKETLQTVKKQIEDENNSNRGTPPEANLLPPLSESNSIIKSNHLQLIFNTSEQTETIEFIFPSSEQKLNWEKSFLEAKKVRFEMTSGRRDVTFREVLLLPHNRPGSEFSCGTARLHFNDLCVCNSEGEIFLIHIQPNLTLKSSNWITSSKINSIVYVPSFQERKLRKKSFRSANEEEIRSMLDIDSTDEEEEENDLEFDEENLSLLNQRNRDCLEMNSIGEDDQHRKDATIWLVTQQGGMFVYPCSQTMKTIGRKNRFAKQFSSPIHFILSGHQRVFLALNHCQLCVFQRDPNGQWDFDNPIIHTIEENSSNEKNSSDQFDSEEDSNFISVMILVAGRLWCAIQDRIFILCPNSLNIQHSFLVDDCHRHVSSIAAGIESSFNHVWISSQGSQDIRLYHAKHFNFLLEINIRTIVTQKLQGCDDIIRAHKLGCLHVTSLHVSKETLWIGTSAGLILNLSLSQLIDSSTNLNGIHRLTTNSLQFKCLPYGHAGPVRLILSTDTKFLSPSTTTTTIDQQEETTMKTSIISIGDGFEDYLNYDENLGKDDPYSHLILWQL